MLNFKPNTTKIIKCVDLIQSNPIESDWINSPDQILIIDIPNRNNETQLMYKHFFIIWGWTLCASMNGQGCYLIIINLWKNCPLSPAINPPQGINVP